MSSPIRNSNSPTPAINSSRLYRFWNIIEYWSPNREIVGEDWDGVLRQFLPRVMLAKDSDRLSSFR